MCLGTLPPRWFAAHAQVELFEAFTDFETCNSYEIYNAETGQLLFM